MGKPQRNTSVMNLWGEGRETGFGRSSNLRKILWLWCDCFSNHLSVLIPDAPLSLCAPCGLHPALVTCDGSSGVVSTLRSTRPRAKERSSAEHSLPPQSPSPVCIECAHPRTGPSVAPPFSRTHVYAGCAGYSRMGQLFKPSNQVENHRVPSTLPQ
jgi:hypothetical protein